MSFGFGFALPAYPLRGGGGNNPFNQLGPTLDLSFVDGATNVGDLSNPNGYTLNTNFITPQYQVAAQYVVWETGVGLVDKTFSQIVTFSRTSGATWFNSAGVNVGIDFSTSSVAIGTGSKSFTLDATAGVNRSWTAGDIVRISEQATPANFMDGTVTSYTASTQTLVVNVTATGGSGTIASWRVSNWMPRFDYNPATLAAQGLLIEEARTNLMLYSEQFDNPAWSKSAATITANATNSPDGTANADKLIATAVSANHYLSSGTVTISAGASVTASVYVKAAEYNTIRVAAYNAAITSGFRVDANLSTVTGTTGTLGTGSATGSSVTNVGGGWYRVTVSGIIDASSTGIVMWVQMLAAGVTPFLGDGTSGIFVFGTQLEAGAFPTSYIPTTVAQATRNADVASVNTLSPWYNQSEMTFYAEYAPIYTASATVPSNTPHVLQAYNTAVSTNNYGIRGAEISLSQIFVARNPTVGAQFPAVALGSYGQAGVVRKLGYAINSSDLQPAVNGALGTVLSNNAAALMATHDRMDIGSGTGGSPPYQLNGWIQRITYYPRRLSNAELVSITS